MCRKFLWIIAFASSLIFSQIASADSDICRESLSKMVKSLDLDDAQKAKIQPILDQLKSNMKNSTSQMGGIEDQLTAQTNAADMDQSKVNSLVDTKTKLVGDMMKARIMAKHQIFTILNPQQKSKLQEKMKKENDKIAAEYRKCEQDDD